MFGVLVESGARRERRRGVMVASVAVHAGVILLGALATARSEPPPPVESREELVPDIFTVPPPAPVATSRSAARSASDAAPSTPAVPKLPALPGIEVPAGLPPLDQALGDPFARVDHVPVGSVHGVRTTTGLVPGGVLDNRSADKPALPLETNQPPAYPEMLRSAAIEGMVEIEFIIDRDGRVRQGSLTALRSDHPRFLEAVRAALAEYRYLPAEAGGSAVAVLVRQRFEFRLGR